MDIPVFLVNGFLESGKTLFIQEVIKEGQFDEAGSVLLVACEEGIEEYDMAFLKQKKVHLEIVENEEDLNENFFSECQKRYRPDAIMIEYNGMWDAERVFNIKLPRRWGIVQVIVTVDTTTFTSYWNNMRSLMVNQFKEADMVVFNRCEGQVKKSSLRASVRGVNPGAQIIYESSEGVTDKIDDDDLPFDIKADVIEIADTDFGLWYVDAIDNPKKYEGKTVKFKGQAYRNPKMGKTAFVPGRFAMTCCADDVGFVGFYCNYENAGLLKQKDWVMVTADIKVEYKEDYQGEGPVLYAKNVEPCEKAEQDLVYFS
ncbi:GTPase [Falcatimonas sp. MSJ-15]|uniref:TIGR03943 family putative permease subunit n=1 Tax=Falcatimonas sp. MSJ-15 TaxID=2841515 RepID=UPI001C1223AB|nr:GTP-binding protein [Falcatimonas sp. MSJ-15]MBU5469605.1 GTPase [Falcatimonas sp. MSJ-15]